MAAIRYKLKEQAAKSGGSGEGRTFDKTVYPFWNLPEGGESSIRFLPDGDQNNTFFWVEKSMIRLPFAGVKGSNDNRQVLVQVPCMEMYGEVDPIITEIRPWWNDDSLKDLARAYYKKRSYVFQGLVVKDGMNEEGLPENPIRQFFVSPQLMPLIKAALLDDEIEDIPTDYVNGIDFKITKNTKGGYADYSTSNWSRRTRPLSEAELDAVNTYGLKKLVDLLPKKPDAAAQRAIKEMFEASVNGEQYDTDRWGTFYRPAGTSTPSAPSKANDDEFETARPAARAIPAAAVNTDDDSDDDSGDSDVPAAKPANRADDILKMIRSRQK
jgi:hypothetical protein